MLRVTGLGRNGVFTTSPSSSTPARCSASPAWSGPAAPTSRLRSSASPPRRPARSSSKAARSRSAHLARRWSSASPTAPRTAASSGLSCRSRSTANISLAIAPALPVPLRSDRPPQGARDRRGLPPAAEHPRPPRSITPTASALRRQPAEGRHQQVAGDKTQGADPRRTDPRHRRRRQGRRPPTDRRPGRVGHGDHPHQLRPPRGPRHERPHPGHARGSPDGHLASARPPRSGSSRPPWASAIRATVTDTRRRPRGRARSPRTVRLTPDRIRGAVARGDPRGRDPGLQPDRRRLPVGAVLHAALDRSRDHGGRWPARRRWSILTRNVDLSVGSIVGVTAYVTGELVATNPGLPPRAGLRVRHGAGVCPRHDQRRARRLREGAGDHRDAGDARDLSDRAPALRPGRDDHGRLAAGLGVRPAAGDRRCDRRPTTCGWCSRASWCWSCCCSWRCRSCRCGTAALRARVQPRRRAPGRAAAAAPRAQRVRGQWRARRARGPALPRALRRHDDDRGTRAGARLRGRRRGRRREHPRRLRDDDRGAARGVARSRCSTRASCACPR